MAATGVSSRMPSPESVLALLVSLVHRLPAHRATFFSHLVFLESFSKQQKQDLGGEQRLPQAAADGRMNEGEGTSQER